MNMENENLPPSAEIPLTTEGTELRTNLIDGDGNAVDWQTAVEQLDVWLGHASNESPLITEWGGTSLLPYTEAGDRQTFERITRFYESYRSLSPRAYTSVVTLTATPIVDGEWIGALDHLDGLLESWEEVRQQYYDEFHNQESEYARILEPTSLGFAHCHLAIVSDEEPSEEGLERIVQAHIDNSRLAKQSQHVIDRCVRWDRSLSLPEIVGENLQGFEMNRDDSWETKAHDSLLWASDTPRVLLSDGAQDLASEVEPVSYDPTLTEI